MITLEIDQAFIPLQERLSESLCKAMEDGLNEVVKGRDGIIAVSFVGDAEIRRLNRMYREKDSVTDVLSFGYTEQSEAFQLIGDVAICLPQAKRQAENGDIELELVDLIIHGALHTLGFDHETPHDAEEMFPKQDAIVQSVL